MASGSTQRFATRSRPPRVITDGNGRAIRIEAFEGDIDELAAMYDDFDASQRAQGLPPFGQSAIQEWLDSLVGPDCHNLVARHDGCVVGHAALVPDEETRHELAIFVHQDYQRAGIGEALLTTTLAQGRTHGVERVWLVVERRNRAAINLYEKLGFETLQERSCEREMELRLHPGNGSIDPG
ncbi:MAG: N-acetyltransferase family protein [Halodesulfurarchaeum sp.]